MTSALRWVQPDQRSAVFECPACLARLIAPELSRPLCCGLLGTVQTGRTPPCWKARCAIGYADDAGRRTEGTDAASRPAAGEAQEFVQDFKDE